MVGIDDNIIVDTHVKLKTFILEKTLRLIESTTHEKLPANYMSELQHYSTPQLGIATESLETTPLYQLFEYQTDESLVNKYAHQTLKNSEFYPWAYDHVVPFFNVLNKLYLETHNHQEILSAFKMMIIIFGDYCCQSRVEDLTFDPKMKSFIKQCEKLRGRYSHRLSSGTHSDFAELCDAAKLVNNKLTDEAGLDKILFPTFTPPEAAQAKLNPKAPIFVPRKTI